MRALQARAENAANRCGLRWRWVGAQRPPWLQRANTDTETPAGFLDSHCLEAQVDTSRAVAGQRFPGQRLRRVSIAKCHCKGLLAPSHITTVSLALVLCHSAAETKHPHLRLACRQRGLGGRTGTVANRRLKNAATQICSNLHVRK